MDCSVHFLAQISYCIVLYWEIALFAFTTCAHDRFGCCLRCSSCVLSLTLTCVSASSSVSCRYCRTMPSNWAMAGHLYWASLATLLTVKGTSHQLSSV